MLSIETVSFLATTSVRMNIVTPVMNIFESIDSIHPGKKCSSSIESLQDLLIYITVEKSTRECIDQFPRR